MMELFNAPLPVWQVAIALVVMFFVAGAWGVHVGIKHERENSGVSFSDKGFMGD